MLAACACAAALLLSSAPASAQTGGFTRTVPTSTYFATLSIFYDGDYRAALVDFLSEGRGAIKNGANHWIDSICYNTMAGECYYQLGQYGPALNHYTNALNLYVAFNNWMLRVQFDAAIRPAGAGSIKMVPWGGSKRVFRLGSYKDTTLIAQGQINNNLAVMRGGVVQQPVLFPINVQEIVRCTALAMRRRRELLGPIGPSDPLANELVAVLSRRPGIANHWSEVWIDVQLGMAYAGAGRDAQAKTVLERAIVAGGEYDHPMTGMVLLELGRIALTGGDFVTAAKYFEEATYAAVNYYDPSVLEEAFRLGFANHLIANNKGMYPPLALAEVWAKREDSRQLMVSLATMTAENACALGETKTALNWVGEARTAIGNRDMGRAKLGARLNFVNALALYQAGQMGGGDTAFTAAMNFQRNGSLWIFQIGLVDALLNSPAAPLTPRAALDLYANVLRDPLPSDWLSDPIESLSLLVVPHPISYENWFNAAIARKEYERALEISDLAKRHRFNSSQEFGGRLMNLRWVMEGPAELLDKETLLQRQDLLLHYPGYSQLSQKAQSLRAELERMPLVPDDAEIAKTQTSKLAELGEISAAQEIILREIALRREPCNLVFPPFRTTKEMQQALPEGTALLAFYCTTLQTHAFLMTSARYGYWPLASPSLVQKQVVGLLRDLGNFEQNKEMRLAELQESKWEKRSHDLLDMLMKDSKVTLPYSFKELVVVPDNSLWYVPFETLQVTDGDSLTPLISKLRIRYAPTVGLGVPDSRPRLQGGNTAVVLGRLFPNDADEAAEMAFQEIEKSVPGAVAIKGRLSVSSGLYASLFNRMIVISDVTPADSPYAWSPVTLDHNSPGSTLASWFSLPWGGPDQIMLPGFHTPAENALKHSGNGSELFYSICGLMSTGARTVLISRWRPGGHNSINLVREFAQELPRTTAADAWQRSVLLESATPLDPTLEPRVNKAGMQSPPTAEHPFFWAGFLLADTGAKPHADDEAPADNVVKVKDAKPAAEKPPEKK
jgi:tetratricopeptide (TPR) repeat protein